MPCFISSCIRIKHLPLHQFTGWHSEKQQRPFVRKLKIADFHITDVPYLSHLLLLFFKSLQKRRCYCAAVAIHLASTNFVTVVFIQNMKNCYCFKETNLCKKDTISTKNTTSNFCRYLSSKNSMSCQQTLLIKLLMKTRADNICLFHHSQSVGEGRSPLRTGKLYQ